MKIKYIDSIKQMKNYPIKGFCLNWKKPITENKLKKICENSKYFIMAIDEIEDKVVGIITVLTDEINWVFIPYLEVLPEYQKMRIGSKLVKKIIKKYKKIGNLDLMCDKKVQPFYEKIGMKKSHGMVLRKY